MRPTLKRPFTDCALLVLLSSIVNCSEGFQASGRLGIGELGSNTGPSASFGTPTEESPGRFVVPVNYSGATSLLLTADHVSLVSLGTVACDKSVELSGQASAKVILTNCRSAGVLRVRLEAGTATGLDGQLAAGIGPSPEIMISTTIKNPYYSTADWKVWGLDSSPVTLGGGTITSLPPGERQIPDFSAWSNPPRFSDNFTLMKLGGTDAAGSWDDGYASMDALHSNLGSAGWSDGQGHSLNFSGQFITTPNIVAYGLELPEAGINFTSQSYASQGHQRACAYGDYFESTQMFKNIVSAAPGYLSYRETLAEKTIDQYDGLFSHYFNSLGRSSSEMGAIGKMLAAGAYLPRVTKNLLKKHGAYASTIMMIFKATLPYADSLGRDVAFENELLHKPVYYSHGLSQSTEFHTQNLYYHLYDEATHLHRMLKLAKSMTVAPPVAIIKVLGITVTDASGATLVSNAPTDGRIKSAMQTNARVWGNAGETITLRVDAGASYDLQALPLSYELRTVYPEQKNVRITREGVSSVFQIEVKHDAKLPKGRIPVIVTVGNGQFKSNPAFVNFYFSEPAQLVCNNNYFNPTPEPSAEEVNRNLRPLLSTTAPSADLSIGVGQTATFDVNCRDPEGFPTRIYRWSGERGTVIGNRFTFSTTAADVGIFPQHFICSDGTGGYNSTLVTITVK